MDFLLVFFILATTAPQSQKQIHYKKKKKTSEKRAGKGNVQNIGWYQCSVSYCVGFEIALAFRDCVNDSKVYCQAETIGKEVHVRE